MTEPDPPESDDPRALLRPQGAAECTAAALRLLEAARERVRILPQRADLRYLTDDAVIGALRALLLRNRRARLEILVPADVARDDQGRPLWNLAQRLTSAVAVHRLADAGCPADRSLAHRRSSADTCTARSRSAWRPRPAWSNRRGPGT